MTEQATIPVIPEFDPPHPALAEASFFVIGQVIENTSGQNYRTSAAAGEAAILLDAIGDLLFPDSDEFSEEELKVVAEIGKTLSNGSFWNDNDAIGEPLDILIEFTDDGFTIKLHVIALIAANYSEGEEE